MLALFRKEKNKLVIFLEMFRKDLLIIFVTHMIFIVFIRVTICKVISDMIFKDFLIAIIVIIIEYLFLCIYNILKEKLQMKKLGGVLVEK